MQALHDRVNFVVSMHHPGPHAAAARYLRAANIGLRTKLRGAEAEEATIAEEWYTYRVGGPDPRL